MCKQKEGTKTGRQSDRQVAPEVTGESCSLSAGRQSLLLGHCSSSPPLPLPWLRVGGSDDVTAAHTFARTRACKRTHTHSHTHTPSLLALCRSVSLTLTLLYAAILGSGAWNNPRVRMSVCVRVYVSPDFTLTHAHIHTHNTVRRTHLLSVWLQEWSSGSRNPLAEDSFQFYAQLFLAGFFSAAFPALPPRLLWISNNHPLAVCSGATSEARPESDLLSPGCLLSFSHGDAQPERRQKVRAERGKRKLTDHILTHITVTVGFYAPWWTFMASFQGTWAFA